MEIIVQVRQAIRVSPQLFFCEFDRRHFMIRQNIQSIQVFFRRYSLQRREIIKIARVPVHDVRHKLEPVERFMTPHITLSLCF